MENFPIYEIDNKHLPKRLFEIPQPPKKLFARGKVDFTDKKILTVVGPRKYTSYGEDCARKLILSLQNLPVIIVSGLAYGVDSIAHETALLAGLTTIAFPGSGLNENAIYPAVHKKLAQKILDNGGMLISEFKNEEKGAPWMFPQRNRLVAGIAQAILIPEAGEKSGTLITARLAVDYNRDLLVVPGNINNLMSKGTNQFLRLGAVPITCADDLHEALGFARSEDKIGFSPSEIFKNNPDLTVIEKEIISCLIEPLSRAELFEKIQKNSSTRNLFSISEFNISLTLLEIKNLIKISEEKIEIK